jgi:hypothetical protein
VHPAVADRVDCAALDLAAPAVVERERVTLGARLLDDEDRQAAVTGRASGSVRASSMSTSARPRRSPRLHAVHEPAASVGVAVTFTPATSEP